MGVGGGGGDPSPEKRRVRRRRRAKSVPSYADPDDGSDTQDTTANRKSSPAEVLPNGVTGGDVEKEREKERVKRREKRKAAANRARSVGDAVHRSRLVQRGDEGNYSSNTRRSHDTGPALPPPHVTALRIE